MGLLEGGQLNDRMDVNWGPLNDKMDVNWGPSSSCSRHERLSTTQSSQGRSTIRHCEPPTDKDPVIHSRLESQELPVIRRARSLGPHIILGHMFLVVKECNAY